MPENMIDRRKEILKCVIRTLGAFAVMSIAFHAFVAAGISNTSREIGEFAKRLLLSDLALFGFSAVYGFSFLILKSKKMPAPASRFLHILINGTAFLLCTAALFSNVKKAEAAQWIVFLSSALLVYLAVYGIASLVSFFIRRAKNRT